MKARNTDGDIVEVTKKAYSTLYRYKGWTLVKDEEGKAIESVPEAKATPKEVENEYVDLSKLKKAELQELASEKGLDFKADDTKEDLINLLNA
jgi:hypothetical protein|nr:MAG TPA: dimeris T4 recombination endonuclease VII [Caudoviricetes sp.]